MSECIEWQGHINSNGYGKTSHKGKYVYAHRLALAEHDGIEIPDRSVKCLHSCDNPPCVNPEHLRWGTQKDNIQDMVSRNRLGEHPPRKVTPEMYDEMKRLRSIGHSYREIGLAVGMSKAQTFVILREK